MLSKNRNRIKNNFSLIDIFVWLFVIFVLIIVLSPLMNVLSLSLSSSEQVLTGNVSVFPKGFTFASFASILKSGKILRAYTNSFLYTGTAVCISLILCTATAYPLARKVLPARNFFITMILFTMFFNGGIIPFYILMQNLGLMNSMWALVIPWAIPPFELFLLKNFFENVPEEIHEAAVIDGASEYKILYNIFIPVAKPIFATLAIFFAMAQWNNYITPLMYITSPSKFPLQLVLQEMLIEEQAKSSTQTIEFAALTSQGLKNATIVLSVLPLLVLYPFLQKYFIGSIYVGAVKG